MKKTIVAFAISLIALIGCGTDKEQIEIDRNGETCTIEVHQNNSGALDRDYGPYWIPCEITEANDSDGHK